MLQIFYIINVKIQQSKFYNFFKRHNSLTATIRHNTMTIGNDVTIINSRPSSIMSDLHKLLLMYSATKLRPITVNGNTISFF